MAVIGPFNNVPTGAVYVLQSTGVNGDIVLGPINYQASGITTGTVQNNTLSYQRFFFLMGA
jgi:hypothetical protein